MIYIPNHLLNECASEIKKFITNCNGLSKISNSTLYKLIPKELWSSAYKSGIKSNYMNSKLNTIKLLILYKYSMEKDLIVEIKPRVKIRVQKSISFSDLKQLVMAKDGYEIKVTSHVGGTYVTCSELGIISRLYIVMSERGHYVDKLNHDQIVIHEQFTKSEFEDIINDNFSSDVLHIRYRTI